MRIDRLITSSRAIGLGRENRQLTAISVDGTNMFIVAKAGTLYAYDDHTFELIDTVEVNLEESNTREPLEIISMNISHDCKYIAVIIGKQLIKDEELITKMVIMGIEGKQKGQGQ